MIVRVVGDLKGKKLNIRLSTLKIDILIVALWTIIISLIIVKAHWTLYATSERMRNLQLPFSFYSPPSLDAFDMVVLLVTSMVSIVLLSDIKTIIYGFIASHSVALGIGVAYISWYIWVVLDYQFRYSLDPFGWEEVVFVGILNVVYLAFPWLIGLSVLGLIIGVTFRGLIFSS